MKMNNKKISVEILCEGLEEQKYIKKLTSFPNIFSNIYSFQEPINCKGITNIFPRYQDVFSRDIYELILIFCDADNNSKDFQNLCYKIDNHMFGSKKVSSKVVIFSNPVTLQIVLSHFGEVMLHSSAKAKNQSIIYQLTGIDNYQAHENQIDEMMRLIKITSYDYMKSNVSRLSSDIRVLPSTNFYFFLNHFEKNSVKWVDEINDLVLI